MRARITPLADLEAADLEAWRELAGGAIEPNPFFDPDYVVPLARGLAQQQEVALAVVESESGWQACLPVTSRRWHRVPLPARTTWRGHVLYGLLGTPLVRADGLEALGRLIELLRRQSPRPSFVALEWLQDGGRLDALGIAKHSGARTLEFERFERAALERRAEEDYLEQTLSSKHRRELRRQRRKLSELLGDEIELRDRSGDPTAIGELIRLEATGSKAGAGTVLAAAPGHREFFETMCDRFRERGALQVLELAAGDRTLAVKCNLHAGRTLFMLKIAFDEEYSAYSPGIQLETEMLKVFHQMPNADLMDSCADPNNAMINRLWPDRRVISSHVLPADGPQGRLAGGAVGMAKRLRDWNRERRTRGTDSRHRC